MSELIATLEHFTEVFSGWISMPLTIILIGTGLFVTLALGFIQIRRFKHSFEVVSGKYDNPDDEGDVTHFQALSAALSATIGIGNIAGVALAVRLGGPGALFWMWVTALFGMALKYAECTLSHRYRVIHKDGSASGGPMYYIEKGLGPKWKPLAVFFATCAVICSFCTGNMNQANTIAQTFATYNVPIWLSGAVIACMVGLVIIGGIKRIGNVTSKLAPFMAALYVAAALLIIFANLGDIPASFAKIFSMAFNPPAAVGGIAGGTLLVIMNTMLWGVKRGLYSNEAGQGSAPIAHSTAKTEFAVREGAVALLEPFIDTIIICTLTGLTIIVTGAWYHTEFYTTRIDPEFAGSLLNGSLLTSLAFKDGLAYIFPYGDKIITLGVLLFGISTVISWSFYGDRSTEYLFGEKAIPIYRGFYILFVFIGAIASLEAIWSFGDAALGFMTFPNLLSIILLSGVLKKMTKEYFEVDHPTYK